MGVFVLLCMTVETSDDVFVLDRCVTDLECSSASDSLDGKATTESVFGPVLGYAVNTVMSACVVHPDGSVTTCAYDNHAA